MNDLIKCMVAAVAVVLGVVGGAAAINYLDDKVEQSATDQLLTQANSRTVQLKNEAGQLYFGSHGGPVVRIEQGVIVQVGYLGGFTCKITEVVGDPDYRGVALDLTSLWHNIHVNSEIYTPGTVAKMILVNRAPQPNGGIAEYTFRECVDLGAA